MHDLSRAVDALADALASGARLVVFEFAIEAVDGAARRWCAEHGLKRPTSPESAPEVIPLAAAAAGARGALSVARGVPTPYHALESGRPEVEAAEREAIAAGRILPAGARLAYERKRSTGRCLE